jgi:hypothetical protein
VGEGEENQERGGWMTWKMTGVKHWRIKTMNRTVCRKIYEAVKVLQEL